MTEFSPLGGVAEGASANHPAAAVFADYLSIRDADGIRGRLTQLLAADGPLKIDVSKVTGIDTSVIQILIAAKRRATERGCALEIEGFDQSPLPAFMTAIGLCPADLSGPAGARAPAEQRPTDQADAVPAVTSGTDDDATGGLFWLTDEQMAWIRPFFPTKPGKRRADDRTVLSGIIFVKRNGLRWSDAPEPYGPSKTLYARWKRWRDAGVFATMVDRLTAQGAEQAPAAFATTCLTALQTA